MARRTKNNTVKTDFEKITDALKKIGAISVGEIGYLEPASYYGFYTDFGSIIVARTNQGQIGLYHFVGNDGDSVEKDIAYILSLPNKQE